MQPVYHIHKMPEFRNLSNELLSLPSYDGPRLKAIRVGFENLILKIGRLDITDRIVTDMKDALDEYGLFLKGLEDKTAGNDAHLQ